MKIEDIDAKLFADMLTQEWLIKHTAENSALIEKAAEMTAQQDCTAFLMWTLADKLLGTCPSCVTRKNFLLGFLAGIQFCAQAVEIEQLQKLHDLNPEAKS